MAAIKSLGIHVPSALDYLVAESILPPNPSPDDYTWTVYDQSAEGLGEEELLSTGQCVVWSVAGVVRRAFNFEHEGQKLTQALLTWFFFDDNSVKEDGYTEDDSDTERPRKPHRRTAGDDWFNTQKGVKSFRGLSGGASWHRALVVVLRQQAHVYLLNGSSHILNLPFEVERAFAAPKGVLLQRQLSEKQPVPPTPVPPAAPPNSFFSSQAYQWQAPRSRNTSGGTIIDRISGAQNREVTMEDFKIEAPSDATVEVPRLFSLTDPILDVGLVSDTGTSRVGRHSILSQSSIQDSPSPVGDDEEIIYISSRNELEDLEDPGVLPLIILVTVNRVIQTLSVWHAMYVCSDTAADTRGVEASDETFPRRKIRSSMGGLPGTGASTPLARAQDRTRESFGASFQGQAHGPASQKRLKRTSDSLSLDNAQDAENALNLEAEMNSPGKHNSRNRRVSSLLARAELAGPEQNSFSELARNQSSWAGSASGPSFRGQSFEKHGDRGSFGRSRLSGRVSSSNAMSRLSDVDETMQQDFGEERLLEDLQDNIDFAYSFPVGNELESLKTELAVTKICMVPMPEPFLSADFPEAFVSVSGPRHVEGGKTARRLSVSLFGDRTNTLAKVDILMQFLKPRLQKSWPEKQNTKAWLPSKVLQFQTGMRPMKARQISSGKAKAILSLSTTSPTFNVSSTDVWTGVIPNELAFEEKSSVQLEIPKRLQSCLYKPLRSTPAFASEGFLSRPAIAKVAYPGSEGCFDMVDSEGRHHRLQLLLRPHSPYAIQILELCSAILSEPGLLPDDPFAIWWRVCCQIDGGVSDLEWRGTLITVCVIGLWLVGYNHSTLVADEDTTTLRTEEPFASRMFSGDACWGWTQSVPGNANQLLLGECMSSAKRLVNLPSGASLAQESASLKILALAQLLVALHLLQEEQKLDITSEGTCSGDRDLGPLLVQFALWLGWETWTSLKSAPLPFDDQSWVHQQQKKKSLQPHEYPPALFDPPCIFSWCQQAFKTESVDTFPTLVEAIAAYSTLGRVNIPGDNQNMAARFTPRTTALNGLCKDLRNPSRSSHAAVQSMIARRIDVSMLETLPEGIAAMLRTSIARAPFESLTEWPSAALKLIGREDLDLLINHPTQPSYNDNGAEINEVERNGPPDIHFLSETANQTFVHPQSETSYGLLEMRQFIFRQDKRAEEAAKLLNPLTEALAEAHPSADSTEAEFLEYQKALAQRVYTRTMAIPSGKAIQDYACLLPLPSQRIAIGTFNTSCRMQPSNVVVNADRLSLTEERVAWAFFHAGASAGLSVVRNAESIDTSWLVLNKPQELGNRHAGLLLALGLNGNLKSMAKWLAFKYLMPKHNMTSIGLLLGLCASRLGTMDVLTTRLLTVHLTCLLPPGSADLNLAPMVQTAAIMSVGLLFYNSQHRRMSELILREIAHVGREEPSGTNQPFRDEAYRLAAGFALGLINLGKGDNMQALHDLKVEETLLKIAIGPNDVEVVHIIAQATAPAIIAMALIYMKTNDPRIARLINIPDSIEQFDYVRPDTLLLRVMASHIILWDSIEPTHEWIASRLPAEYIQDVGGTSFKEIAGYVQGKELSSEYLPFYNIVAGLCWSISLRFAGSCSERARKVILDYYDFITAILRRRCSKHDQKVTRDTLLRVQRLLALSAATVMAGSGDYDVLVRLRVLHAKVPRHVSFGHHQATHIAIGCLFMGRGQYTFSTSNLALASLICAFYPIFPKDVLDNKSHLQAFRHFWTLAAEPRCLVAKDIETKLPVITPVVVELRDGPELDLWVPCLLPNLDTIAKISTESDEYWKVTLNFAQNPAHLAAFRAHQTIYLRRKSLVSQHNASPFDVSLANRTEPRFSAHIFNNILERPLFRELGIGPAEALAILPRGQGSDFRSESRLPIALEASKADMETPPPVSTLLSVRTTAVDDLLALKKSVASDDRDRLMGLKVLFEWATLERGEQREILWLQQEAVDALKAEVLQRMRKEADSAE